MEKHILSSPILCAMALFVLGAAPARAEVVVLTWSGTVSFATGELDGPIAANDTVTGTVTYETTTAGVFTPSPNPTFVRAEMLYTGAISASDLTINGDTASGTTGDIEILDSDNGMFAGDDSWEATASFSSGTIGGFALSNILVNPSFLFSAYTLSASDPVPDPLEIGQATFPQFLLASAGGGSAYGSIDSYSVSGASTPAPALGAWGIAALMATLILVAARSQYPSVAR